MRRSSPVSWAAAAALWLGPAVALAADPQHGGGGLPQLNPATYSSQLFWAAVLFLLLYLLMSKLALPRVGALLEERNRRIGEDLDQASRAQQEADAALAEYERGLAEARSQALTLVQTVNDELAGAAAESQRALAAELAAQTRDAEARIDAARRGALEQIRSIATETALAAASRLAGADLDRARVEAAVQAVAQERR